MNFQTSIRWKLTSLACICFIAAGLLALVTVSNAADRDDSKPAAAEKDAFDAAINGDYDKEFDQQILELYEKKKILNPIHYPALRKLMVGQFIKKHDREIRKALGDDYDEMQKWFEANREIYEDFCMAIDEPHDKIDGAFSLFNQLRKEFPKDLPRYGNLAIATAVVWDVDEQTSYEHIENMLHQTKAKYDHKNDTLALDNFRYFVENEANMQGRILFSPWEFLVHVVNQRTPVKERSWALSKYSSIRTMFGKCYSKVPYDMILLRTQGQQSKIMGRDYTLQNILEFGGVCAQQADYAMRVGKNLGIPAEYVYGVANDLGRHAWVMWVELRDVKKGSLKFTLESHGRYNEDNYYVGELEDPQSGKTITDRNLEIDLYAVGNNVVGKRQADLALRAYPRIKEITKLTTAKEIAFLKEIILRSQASRDPWIQIAKVARENRGNKELSPTILSLMNQLFATFGEIPDFTWVVFEDFASFQTDIKARAKLYEKLCNLYENAKRPDLACEARLVYADLLVEQKQQKNAVDALVFCIKKFPDEGRYVPKMLDKIDRICADITGAGPVLIRFYKEFLPLVPKYRADEASQYAYTVYSRASKIFTQYDEADLAKSATKVAEQLKKENPRIEDSAFPDQK